MKVELLSLPSITPYHEFFQNSLVIEEGGQDRPCQHEFLSTKARVLVQGRGDSRGQVDSQGTEGYEQEKDHEGVRVVSL